MTDRLKFSLKGTCSDNQWVWASTLTKHFSHATTQTCNKSKNPWSQAPPSCFFRCKCSATGVMLSLSRRTTLCQSFRSLSWLRSCWSPSLPTRARISTCGSLRKLFFSILLSWSFDLVYKYFLESSNGKDDIFCPSSFEVKRGKKYGGTLFAMLSTAYFIRFRLNTLALIFSINWFPKQLIRHLPLIKHEGDPKIYPIQLSCEYFVFVFLWA